MVVSLLKKFGPTSRKEIDKLLLEKLPDILTQEQKENKIRNLLQEMSFVLWMDPGRNRNGF